MKNKKIAVVGALGLQGKKHVEELKQIEMEVITCDKKDGAQYRHVQEMLENESVYGVVIATPNETHYEIATQFLKHRCGMLLEKPTTRTWLETKNLFEEAKECQTVLMPGSVFSFNNAVKKVGELLKENVVGDVELVKCTWQQHLNPHKEPDIMLDLGPHTYDILRSWNFKPGCGRVELTKKKDHCIVITKSGQTKIEWHLSWILGPKKREIKVIGSEGLIVLDALHQELRVFDENEQLIGCRTSNEFWCQGGLDLEYQVNNTIKDELLYFLKQIDEFPRWELVEQAIDFLRWREENCFFTVGEV